MSVPAHTDTPIEPSALWSSWNWDPIVWLGLFTAAAVYYETWHRTAPHRVEERWARRSFVAGMLVLAVALVSPLDAMSASLGSAHMVQHLLLITVAAPLLVVGAPVRFVLRGLPRQWRRTTLRWRTSAGGRLGHRLLANPVAASVPAVIALWCWHLPALYDAALSNGWLHGLEHATFLLTALLSWAAILAAGRRRTNRCGLAVLVLFALATQSGLLGVLLTFAPRPWYPSYEATTEAWGLTPLADQQLAGVIMWVPAGSVYMVVALLLVSRWIRMPAREVIAPRAAQVPH